MEETQVVVDHRYIERMTLAGKRFKVQGGDRRYYPRLGFESAGKWKIKVPFEGPSNVFMAMELEEDGLNNNTGTIMYPKEFEAE